MACEDQELARWPDHHFDAAGLQAFLTLFSCHGVAHDVGQFHDLPPPTGLEDELRVITHLPRSPEGSPKVHRH